MEEMMGRESSHKRVNNPCTEYKDIWLNQLCIWKQKQSPPEEEVSVSMATTKEQPRLSKCG